MFYQFTLIAVVLLAPLVFAADEASGEFPPMPPVQARTPEETVRSMELPPGYRLEVVLSEPEIEEPVLAAFDGNGRLFVAEMRTYMRDIDGTAEHEPTSRVSLHWSSQGDGKLDRHTVFADKLLLPRILLPLDKDRVLIGETDTNDLYIYSDTDGDGVSDKKELFYEGGPRGGNLEHQPNGPVWALDNWLYTTYNNYRLRWTPQGVQKEPTAPNGGQWGVSQDDWGKIWYVNAGGEQGPVNFQTGIVYGAFNLPDQFPEDFREVWPITNVPDMQGGERRFRADTLNLNHFTSACGGEIYRGDKLPELRGDLFFGEPVGRLVRRARIDVQDGLTRLRNPHARSEFLRSSDPLFRPVTLLNAPDGTLHLVDMYRGIIQEGNWVREGSYLRRVVQQYQLDRLVGRGRIYRLVQDGQPPGPSPRMNDETAVELAAHLAHPNGWWRDTAQKLLVLKQDRTVIPVLTQMAATHADPLARLHALWTMEGLDAATPELIRQALKDEHPQLRAAALRVSETLIKKGERSLTVDLEDALGDESVEVVMQAMLTTKLLNLPNWQKTLLDVASNTSFVGVREIATQMLNPAVPIAKLNLNPDEEKLFKEGETIFQTLCAACHGMDGKGVAMAGSAPGAMLAPPMAGSKTVLGPKEGSIYVLLHGLVGEIDGKRYEGQMISMASNDDTWIASVLSYVRNSFGNRGSFVTAQEVAGLRLASRERTQPWEIAELRALLPSPIPNRKGWKLSASHGGGETGLAIDDNLNTRYSTRTSQVPGMWFQIELPQETLLGGIQLDSSKSPGDFPRGYEVTVSLDGESWSEPVASGKGSGPVTEIQFRPARARFVRITQTGEVKGLYWSIHELQLFAPKQEASLEPPLLNRSALR